MLPALLVLGLVLLPELVLGVSFRTCFVTLSQHFTFPEEVALDEGDVVEEVCATASPKLAVSIAAAINPVPAIRMRDPSLVTAGGEHSPSPGENDKQSRLFLGDFVTKKEPGVASGAPHSVRPKTVQGDDLTAPLAIQRPAAMRTRNARFVGVQTDGNGSRLPSNSASPCALSGTRRIGDEWGCTGGPADNGAFDLINGVRCPDAVATCQHQTADLKFDTPGAEIDIGLAAQSAPGLAAARNTPDHIGCLDDPDHSLPTDVIAAVVGKHGVEKPVIESAAKATA